MPPYHMLRDGEPPKPEFSTHHEVIWQPEIADAKRKLTKMYLDWINAQPDSKLLQVEFEWLRLDYHAKGRGGLDKAEIFTAWSDFHEIANKLRDSGQGEIVDRYWPFLQDTSSNK